MQNNSQVGEENLDKGCSSGSHSSCSIAVSAGVLVFTGPSPEISAFSRKVFPRYCCGQGLEIMSPRGFGILTTITLRKHAGDGGLFRPNRVFANCTFE